MSKPHGETPEIEITPEMIEAGSRELAYFNPREDGAEARAEILEEIYVAMTRASPLHSSK